ncbi:MAG: hypothetical protein ACRDQ7_22885 [Haloechinothrix sp.]
MNRTETRSRTRTTLLAALTFGAAWFATACGDEPAAPAAPPPTSASAAPAAPSPAQPEGPDEDQQAIVAVIQQYQAAVDKGDGKAACTLMHPDLQGVYAQDPGASDCAGAIENLHKSLGDVRLSNTRVLADDVEVRGSKAVLSHLKIAEANGTKPAETEGFDMVEIDGKWLIEYVS